MLRSFFDFSRRTFGASAWSLTDSIRLTQYFWYLQHAVYELDGRVFLGKKIPIQETLETPIPQDPFAD